MDLFGRKRKQREKLEREHDSRLNWDAWGLQQEVHWQTIQACRGTAQYAGLLHKYMDLNGAMWNLDPQQWDRITKDWTKEQKAKF